MDEAATSEAGLDEGIGNEKKSAVEGPQSTEPRWPALLAFLAFGGLYAALPSVLLVAGPRWLLLFVGSGLLRPAIISPLRGNHAFSQVLGYILNSVITFTLIWSLALLIIALPERKITP